MEVIDWRRIRPDSFDYQAQMISGKTRAEFKNVRARKRISWRSVLDKSKVKTAIRMYETNVHTTSEITEAIGGARRAYLGTSRQVGIQGTTCVVVE